MLCCSSTRKNCNSSCTSSAPKYPVLDVILARYDEDGNGWIDENDSIWSKLKIWCKDENGNDVLYKLSDKGVGAICLQNVSTDFTLQGDRKAQDGTTNANATNAVVRKTGIFLYENGNVGTVQHVDMAAYAAQA